MAIDWKGIIDTLGHKTIKEMLDEMYNTQKMSTTKMGRKIGVSGPTILYMLKEQGISVRSRGGANNVRRVL